MSAAGLDASSQWLTIQEASELLQIPPPTIRSWERRYELLQVSRTPGGHRRYSVDELRMLQQMRDAIGAGLRAVQAAALVKAAAASTPDSLVEAFLDATSHLNSTELGQVLKRAQSTLGLGRAVDDVVLPAMRRVGVLWRAGACDVAHEHVATETVRAWLAAVTEGTNGPWRPRPILLACGPQDLHTIALECMAALLSSRGCECRVLGARTPVTSLTLAIEEVRPAAVIVVCQMATGRTAALQAVESAARRCHTFYAGGAFTSGRWRTGSPGTYLGENLDAAADLVVGQAYALGA